MPKKDPTRKNKPKRSARIRCASGRQFWTTCAQFWQWVREGVVVKTGDQPLSGAFARADEENLILVGHTVLNRACPEHLVNALSSRRLRVVSPRGYVRG